MLARSHIIVSGVISGIWYYIFRSVPDTLVCFFSGFLIDLDHLIDYYLNHPFTLTYRKIYNAFAELSNMRIILLFHSIEFVILIWIYAVLAYPNRVWLALAVGITQHLVFDQIINPTYPFTYFLIYRASKGFRHKHILRKIK